MLRARLQIQPPQVAVRGARERLWLEQPVVRAARALVGRYTCERGDRPNFEPRAQIYTGLASAKG